MNNNLERITMDEEKKEIIYKNVLEASILTYVLKQALAHQEQPNSDTMPFSYVANIIEKRLNQTLEYL